MAEKKTITPSEIIYVYNNGPPDNIDRDAIRRGMEAHRRITNEIVQGKIPLALQRAGVISNLMVREKRVSKEIGPHGLCLNAQCDLINPRVVIELKPGREIRGRYLLQAAIGVIASGKETDAIVFLYESGEATLIRREKISECQPKILEIARAARVILDNQARVDELRKNPPPRRKLTGISELAFETRWIGGDVTEKSRLGQETVEARKQFDTNIQIVTRILNPLRK
ncbi:hypothetical protein KBB48_01595 [Candidatus Shapirobacteria bacterium]|nr:hypothetical protein [Candidatus Shapirobacteria bacterium]